MQPLITLIKPTSSEYITYLAAGFFLLAVSNIKRFWDYFSNGVNFGDVSLAKSLSTTLQDWLLTLEANIDPRVVDFAAWVIIGILAIGIILATQHVIEDTTTELEHAQKIADSTVRQKEVSDYVQRILLRIAGIVVFAFWVRIYIGAAFSELSQAFFISVLKLNELDSWIVLLTTVLFSAIGIYTFVICIRLVALKTRVLG